MSPSRPHAKISRSSRRHIDGWWAVLGGGLVGSALRAAVDMWLPTGEAGFPTAVLMVNLAGSFLLGFYLARRERSMNRRHSLQFWAIGVLGSFTTFSTFVVALVELMAENRVDIVGWYLAASLLGGLALAQTGLRLGSVVR